MYLFVCLYVCVFVCLPACLFECLPFTGYLLRADSLFTGGAFLWYAIVASPELRFWAPPTSPHGSVRIRRTPVKNASETETSHRGVPGVPEAKARNQGKLFTSYICWATKKTVFISAFIIRIRLRLEIVPKFRAVFGGRNRSAFGVVARRSLFPWFDAGISSFQEM